MVNRPARASVPLAVAGLLVSGCLSACGSDNDDPLRDLPRASSTADATVSAPSSPVPEAGVAQKVQPAQTAPPAPTAPVAAGTGRAVPADAGPCTASQLTSRVIRQPSQMGGAQASALLTLTNASNRACTIEGWATLRLTGGRDRGPLRAEKVLRPAPPTVVGVPPGRSAFAGLRWRVCSPSAPTCVTGTGIQVTPPETTTADPATVIGFPSVGGKPFAVEALRLSPFQPSTQDIVNW